MEKLHPATTSTTAPPAAPARGARAPHAPRGAEGAPAPADAAPPVEPTPERLDEAVRDLGEALQRARPGDWRVGIREDDETDSLVIEIRDAEGELIKQLPPEKVLNLRRKLDDLAGVVVDETT